MGDSIIQYNFKAEEMVKAGRTSSYNIEGIRSWLELMPTIPQLSEEQIAIFLIACKNDTEATKNCMLSFFKIKCAAPEIFSNRDWDNDQQLIEGCNITNVALVSQRTKENYAVLIGALNNTSYSKFNIDIEIKKLFTLLDVALYDNPPAGLMVVFDLKGFGLMHITRFKLGTIKKFFHFLQEALALQLKEIHILNSSYVVDKLLMVLKPFMNKELFTMIITHSTNADMDEFFKNHVPKNCFPSDYGGDLPNLEQLSQESLYQCRKMKNYLNSYEQQIEAYIELRD